MRILISLTLLVLLCTMPQGGFAATRLNVGVYDNPPMSYADARGSYRGIFVDLLRQIAALEKWELVIVPGTQPEGIARLAKGEVDLLVSMGYSPDRDRQMDFNEETVAINWGQLYIPKGGELQSYLALEGVRVAVVPGNLHSQALQEMLHRFGVNPRYVQADSYRSVFELVQSREVEAGVVSRFFAKQEEPNYHVAATPMVFNPLEVRYAVGEGRNGEVVAAIDRHLHAWKQDKASVYFRILNTYLGEDHAHSLPRWLLWAAMGGGALLLNLLGGVFWLRAQVRRRTAALTEEMKVRRQAEISCAESEERYRELVEYANSAILKLDMQGTITFSNEFAEQFFGFSREELTGSSVMGTILPNSPDSERELAGLLNPSDQHCILEMENVRKGGGAVRMSWATRPLCDATNRVVGVLAVGQDVSARYIYEQQLLFQATHDQLTGLPNRTLFHDRMEQAMALYDRQRGYTGLMVLDLDNFKMVNDTLGHKAGDFLLQEVVERLLLVIRRTDTLARLGGDEFAIVPVGLDSSDQATVMAEKVLTTLKLPFFIGERELYVTGSIGIATYPQDGESVELLLQHADLAMYEAKRAGKNTISFYTRELNDRMHRRLTLETDLNLAIERDEFLLYYQPQVDLDTGRVVGVEALLRWQRPDGTMVPPGEFIGILEDSGLIIPVGERIIEQAVREAKGWLDAGFGPVNLSINICPRHFQCADIVSSVRDILQRVGLPARHLCLEVTERLLMHDLDDALAKLHELHGLGVIISIDDFGTGYSSLSYIKHLPVSELKIDRDFVMHLPANQRDATIVKTIIGMAESLGMQVVAEGVETDDQRQFLIEHGCRICQGFYFHRPLSQEAMVSLLVQERLEGDDQGQEG